ncbi:hypothetical protein IJG73_02095 [Candidatus Saccharibacteria bacterium]|nr:hypothetical protein [Candidatus Saccharibacteria bacterium]
MSQRLTKLSQDFAKWLQAKAEPDDSDADEPELTVPQTAEELVEILRLTPKNVLSTRERNIIAAAMGFQSRPVSELMLPASEITFVHENDFLGPLMLDKLYKSGYDHFPVKNTTGKIVGVLHTELLNSLKIRETDRAKEYLDSKLYYMRDDYSLEQAFAAFLRTNCFFFLVVNKHAEIVGLFTYKMLAEHILGRVPKDDFDRDQDITAVSRRS